MAEASQRQLGAGVLEEEKGGDRPEERASGDDGHAVPPDLEFRPPSDMGIPIIVQTECRQIGNQSHRSFPNVLDALAPSRASQFVCDGGRSDH